MNQENILKAIKLIRDKEGAKTNTKGTVACPVCGKDIYYSIAYNGHIWGKCETKDCIVWMM